MPFFDTERQVMVVRIVYDGPALSGKTTSLRALAASLGRPLFSGGEAEGRTLFFDWLDYTGGRFDGHPIRCQVVSVPGQRALRARRSRILETADAVVFVADSRRDQVESDVQMARSLLGLLRTVEEPLPGVVVQANKRDAPDAVPLEALRAALSATGPQFAVMESVASTGVGVREAFVFAVRLALDRVRELMRRQAIRRTDAGDSGFVDSGASLLSALLNEEEGDAANARYTLSEVADDDGPLGSLLGSAPAVPSLPAPSSGSPAWPSADAPSGMIWPPVGGRITLQAATISQGPLIREANAWFGASNGWRLRTRDEDEFASKDQARAALVDWARLHAKWATRLSNARCIVCAPSAAETWRLWQIVGPVTSLREEISAVLTRADTERVAAGLLALADAFEDSIGKFADLGAPLPLEEIEMRPDGTAFAGFAPHRTSETTQLNGSLPGRDEAFRAGFAPLLRQHISNDALDVPRILNQLTRLGRNRRNTEVLSAMLIGH